MTAIPACKLATRPLVLLAALSFSGVALAGAPPSGVAQKIRRGFFTETDMGVFFTAGGKPRGYSNGQAYVQLGVGYDIIQQLSVGLSFALGASAAACFDVLDPRGGCGPTGYASDNFTMSFYQLTVAYNFVRLLERVDLAVKVIGGLASMDPAPIEGLEGVRALAGAALGAEYATNLDHFAIGLDVSGRFVIGPNIPAIAIFGRVKYTF